MNEIIRLSNNNNVPTLNFKEAMQFLRVSRSTLYRWMYAGKIHGKKVGVRWRFYLQDCEAQFQDCSIAKLAC